MNHQDLPRDTGRGSSPQSTSSLVQSMGDIVMEDVDIVMDTGYQISIASITLECHQLFKETLANIQQSDEYDIFETQYGRLNIWASNIGAVAIDKSSLDYRLRLSDDIKSMVLQLLEVLKGSLRQALDEGRDPTRRAQVFGEVIEVASASLDRLQNLATVIRKSSAQSRNLRSKALSSDDEVNFKDFVLKVLKHRFKDANGSLCEQIAESVALRRKQFDYKIRHQGKLSRDIADLGPSRLRPEQSIVGTKHRLAASQIGRGKVDTVIREPKRLRRIAPLSSPCRVAPSETNASTLDTKVFRKTLPVYKAPRSIVSQGTSVRDLELEYPPPPTWALEQRECTCPYCCEILSSAHAKNERWWRHHVDTDLEPYSCISEKCRASPTQYAKFQDWLQHMATHGPSNVAWDVHLKMFHCPLCVSLEPFRWKEDFMSHMSTDHAERFTQTQLLTLGRRSTITVIREPHVCPFCNRIPEEIEKITPQNRGKIVELLPRHIAGHLRSLAFMALPYRDDIKDYESDAGRDRSGEGSVRSRRISDLTDLDDFESMETIRHYIKALKPEVFPEADPQFQEAATGRPAQLEWDFVPSEDYEIEQDPVMQHFIATQGEINHQGPPENNLSNLNPGEEMPGDPPSYESPNMVYGNLFTHGHLDQVNNLHSESTAEDSFANWLPPALRPVQESFGLANYFPVPQNIYQGGEYPENLLDPVVLDRCDICRRSFNNKRLFGDHMSKEHGVKAFKCEEPNCHAKYSRLDALRMHIRRVHTVPAKDSPVKVLMSPSDSGALSESASQETILKDLVLPSLKRRTREFMDRPEEAGLQFKESKWNAISRQRKVDDIFEKMPAPQQGISVANNVNIYRPLWADPLEQTLPYRPPFKPQPPVNLGSRPGQQQETDKETNHGEDASTPALRKFRALQQEAKKRLDDFVLSSSEPPLRPPVAEYSGDIQNSLAFRCDQCGAGTSTLELLERHVCNQNVEAQASSMMESSAKAPTMSPSGVVFMCVSGGCRAKFSTYIELSEHGYSAHGIPLTHKSPTGRKYIYRCHHCKAVSQSPDSLAKHKANCEYRKAAFAQNREEPPQEESPFI
ncbi:hypothetical protein TWF506_010093 [Arthrobotrys conoides]|uniref:C2H2-type domain-containing protein n=1 Tax=Arthrobotrys conoides TaxID=74498 RepID=A0AAN8NJR9_9PEZI